MIKAYESGHCERETGLLLLSSLQMLGVARREGCCCKKRWLKKEKSLKNPGTYLIQGFSPLVSEDSHNFRKAHPICCFRGLQWPLLLSNQFIMNSHSEEQYTCKTLGQNCHYHKSTSGRSMYKDRH